ncbi:hypothetical protein PF011_g28948 [Phytophthora fragariae]|uniref:RxLR effector protein n=1 Tax=Phytophthora fragariae TaxID=53985 RepID=A0A6A3H291_9STRA|nr:hypothetical protein PF011_g28948 [Phytophthora fragariae]
MIETTRYFYDDDVLAKMILAAEKNPSTKKLGQRVDEELMKRWTQGVYTPGLNKADEVFQSLKLDQLGDKVLAIPLFGYFSRYVDRYNQANRGKEEPMLSALSQRSVVVMIAAAKKNPSTEKLATKLQAEQIDDWLIHTDSPDEIFNALKLDNSVDNLLTHANFDAWATYLQEFNAKYPSQKDLMIGIFRASFGDRTHRDHRRCAGQRGHAQHGDLAGGTGSGLERNENHRGGDEGGSGGCWRRVGSARAAAEQEEAYASGLPRGEVS